MGNVPAKEGRQRSYTYSSTNSAQSGDASGFITRTSNSRRNTIPNSFGATTLLEFKKSKRKEEKDRQRESHYANLVVRYEENVDGGFLAPYGTYKSNLDYNTDVVRKLIIDRQLAPFYTPLQDFDESWTDTELLILLSQLPLHSIETAYSDQEEEDDVDDHKIHKSTNYYKRQEQKLLLKTLIQKIKDSQKDEELRFLEEKQKIKERQNVDLISSSPEILSKDPISPEIANKDLLLTLYREATECPICFLYYPKNLNVSRCCVQPICTECFVQIKRLDPHPPHDDPSNQQGSEALPHTLISEAASCPYCASAVFGVTYEPPADVSTGMKGTVKAGNYRHPTNYTEDSETVISSSPGSQGDSTPVQELILKQGFTKAAKRRASLAADAKGVITIDLIRPDWESKLASARNKLARKAATASAIHASNLLIQNDEPSPVRQGSDNRRRGTGNSAANAHLRTVEERMIEEALRLSILDEEERQRKADIEESKKAQKP